MGQIKESEFRVVDFDGVDYTLYDLEEDFPVFVEEQNDLYPSSLETKINEMEIGNKIRAEIQSESVTQQDDYWRFLDIEILTTTRFHYIDDFDQVPSAAEKMLRLGRQNDEDIVRKSVSVDGARLGYLSAIPEFDETDLWRDLRGGFRTHEIDIGMLEDLSEPPFEIIYARNSDGSNVFYHLAEQDTELAEKVLDLN
ncbi:hypothetical protein [Halosimplex amylolyticum]|uniref:hypothetical protein n=1 Tax=Halosimplex amylolyticum TaxID=3396616 RepID=UPI003F54BB9D